MASPSSRVLITGANGFTGRWLSKHLADAGYQVYGLQQEPARTSMEIAADLRDPSSLRIALETARPDFIVHLAAITFVPHSDSAEIYRTNLLGTLNLLDAIRDTALQPRKVLLASSANIYGNPTVERINEAVCPAPVNHYATSKLAMEHMARTYQDQIPLLIARPFNYTGPGQDERFLLPKIVGHYRRQQQTIELGNLDVVRDFSDIRFIIEAYRRLLESEHKSETVNLCSGQGTPLREIMARMHQIAGYTIEVKTNPAFVRANEIHRLVGDNSKLRHLIGPLPVFPIDDILSTLYRGSAS